MFQYVDVMQSLRKHNWKLKQSKRHFFYLEEHILICTRIPSHENSLVFSPFHFHSGNVVACRKKNTVFSELFLIKNLKKRQVLFFRRRSSSKMTLHHCGKSAYSVFFFFFFFFAFLSPHPHFPVDSASKLHLHLFCSSVNLGQIQPD